MVGLSRVIVQNVQENNLTAITPGSQGKRACLKTTRRVTTRALAHTVHDVIVHIRAGPSVD